MPARLPRAVLSLLSSATMLAAQAPPSPRSGSVPESARNQPTPRPRYTPAETRAVGLAIVKLHLDKYGRATNAVWQRDVATVVGLLETAAAVPDLDIKTTIINSEEVNAGAVPGGFLIINSGLLAEVAELARRDAPSDSSRQRRQAMAYLAAVLGHEVAHVTLGHTDEIMDRVRRRGFRLNLRDTTLTTRAQAALTSALGDSTFLAAKRHSRDTELAADRSGALYLLRAGWEIQDAMNLFRWFDAEERRSGNTAGTSVTWVRSHPRSAAREASLEEYRAQLKRRQTEFDDALALVANGVMLDTAIAMLDDVLVDFPSVIAARHARAAAFHQKWMASVPVQQLRVRGSVPVYSARFITSIRGDRGDTASLNRARRIYREVLAQRLLPYTLSNLAVLDAYAGAPRLARQRADSAVAMHPNDPEVLNNVGVVLFLAGHHREAKDAFARASDRVAIDDEGVVQAIRFNLGMAFAASGDTVSAREAMRGYLSSDPRSAWGRRAAEFLRFTGSIASASGTLDRGGASGGQPVASSDTKPRVAGIALGDSKATVFAALGPPDDREDQRNGAFWRYRAKGLTLAISDDDGVSLVRLGTREAGEVEGVRVGDSTAVALSRWGRGRRWGDVIQSVRDGWLVTARERHGLIHELMTAMPRTP